MNRMYPLWREMTLAVAVLAGSVPPLLGNPREQSTVGKERTVTGRIVKIDAAAGRVRLQTTDGNQLELSLDSRSQVKLRARDAKLSQLKEGLRVRVTYEQTPEKNRVIELREAPVTADELRQELREALEAAKAYTFQQKEQYQKRLEPVLHDLDERIDRLREQAKGAGKEAQQRYSEAIEELRREREIVRKQLAKVQAAAPGAWEEVKTGMSAAWEDLRKAFQRAHDRLKESERSDKP